LSFENWRNSTKQPAHCRANWQRIELIVKPEWWPEETGLLKETRFLRRIFPLTHHKKPGFL
jgi:hypothetical protein